MINRRDTELDAPRSLDQFLGGKETVFLMRWENRENRIWARSFRKGAGGPALVESSHENVSGQRGEEGDEADKVNGRGSFSFSLSVWVRLGTGTGPN